MRYLRHGYAAVLGLCAALLASPAEALSVEKQVTSAVRVGGRSTLTITGGGFDSRTTVTVPSGVATVVGQTVDGSQLSCVVLGNTPGLGEVLVTNGYDSTPGGYLICYKTENELLSLFISLLGQLAATLPPDQETLVQKAISELEGALAEIQSGEGNGQNQLARSAALLRQAGLEELVRNILISVLFTAFTNGETDKVSSQKVTIKDIVATVPNGTVTGHQQNQPKFTVSDASKQRQEQVVAALSSKAAEEAYTFLTGNAAGYVAAPVQVEVVFVASLAQAQAIVTGDRGEDFWTKDGGKTLDQVGALTYPINDLTTLKSIKIVVFVDKFTPWINVGLGPLLILHELIHAILYAILFNKPGAALPPGGYTNATGHPEAFMELNARLGAQAVAERICKQLDAGVAIEPSASRLVSGLWFMTTGAPWNAENRRTFLVTLYRKLKAKLSTLPEDRKRKLQAFLNDLKTAATRLIPDIQLDE